MVFISIASCVKVILCEVLWGGHSQVTWKIQGYKYESLNWVLHATNTPEKNKRRSSKKGTVKIDAPHPACHKWRIGGAWRVIRYKWSSNKSGVLGLGSRTTNSPVVGSHSREWLPCPVSEFAVPNKLRIKSFTSASGLTYFDVISFMYLVSSGFYKTNLILIDPV